MIRGAVSQEGTPEISITVDGHEWSAIIDMGFNGDLELPGGSSVESLNWNVNSVVGIDFATSPCGVTMLSACHIRLR